MIVMVFKNFSQSLCNFFIAVYQCSDGVIFFQVVFDRQSDLKKESELDMVIHCASGDDVSDCQSDIILEYGM